MYRDLTEDAARDLSLPAFALACAQTETAEVLRGAVTGLGQLSVLSGSPGECAQAVAGHGYRLVFLDFSPTQATLSAELARQLGGSQPQLALVAVGNAALADSVLSALRAGVRDFVDLANARAEAAGIIAHALASGRATLPTAQAPAARGRLVVLLGARAGVGTSCAALNLALLAQRAQAPEGRVLLLDYGIPVADSLLYLGQKKEFDLLQAIHSQSRIDDTFIASAFARHASGLTLLPMPGQPERIREIAYSDVLDLQNLMRGFFPLQVADLGGCSDHDFVAAVARQADEVLLVCDPSAGAVVSARALLQSLGERGVIVSKLKLLLSKYDEVLALTAADMAKRLEVQAVGELPHCHVPLLQAQNQGRALAEAVPTHPYVQALQAVLGRFEWLPAVASAPSSRFERGLIKGLRSLIQRSH